VGGVRELVGDAGVIVAAGNSESLAEAMLGLMGRTADERRKLGGMARSRIESSFSIESRVVEWDALYRDLLVR
jgi:glycosyltransferase involved in cell wall biosynthesis